MTNKKIHINVNLDGKILRLKILPEREEIIRRSVKRLNEEIMQFRQNYKVEDPEKILLMVLLKEAGEKEWLLHEKDLFLEKWNETKTEILAELNDGEIIEKEQ